MDKFNQNMKEPADSIELQNTRPKTKYTFANFIKLECNRFAYESALAVSRAQQGATSLLIIGGNGLGKSHLMQATGNSLLNRDPSIRILYNTSERFMTEMIHAIRHKKLAQFREKYCHLDVLLLDDFNFMDDKEATQEEFFHTIDTLEVNGGLLIMTSDRQLDRFSGLHPALRSRLAGMLNVEIKAPSISDKEIFLKQWAISQDIHVPDDVIKLIATKQHACMRELQGILIKLAALCKVMNKPIFEMAIELFSPDVAP